MSILAKRCRKHLYKTNNDMLSGSAYNVIGMIDMPIISIVKTTD